MTKRDNRLIDRIKDALGKHSREGRLNCSQMRDLKQDASRLATQLRTIRERNPGVPVPTMSAHVYRLLKDATAIYRIGGTGSTGKKAANF